MSDFLKVLGFILIGGGLIIGFIFGVETSEIAQLLNPVDEFSFSVALTWWVSGIVSGSIVMALGMILERVQDMNAKIDAITKQSHPLEVVTKDVE